MMRAMGRDSATTLEFRRAALRMVAAAEYFKAAGDLPPWARAELDSWDDDADDGNAGPRRPDRRTPPS